MNRKWKCSPKWSIADIAKELDCSDMTVWNFMLRNDIPTRDLPNALDNAWDCKLKRNKWIETFESPC